MLLRMITLGPFEEQNVHKEERHDKVLEQSESYKLFTMFSKIQLIGG